MADGFETNIVHTVYPLNDTDNLYGSVRNEAGQIRDVANSAWDAFPVAGDLDDYDISYGVAAGGQWSGDFPDLTACPAGFYIYQIRVGAKALTDPVIASDKGYWNGTTLAKAASLASVPTAEPTGAPSTWNFEQRLNFAFRVFMEGSDNDGSEIKYYKDDDVAVLAKQAVSDVAGVERINKATAP